MNKWIVRLIGLFALGIVVLIFYDYWFRPELPQALQNDRVRVEVASQNGESLGVSRVPVGGVSTTQSPQITLLSAEGIQDNGGMQPQTEQTIVVDKTALEPVQNEVVPVQLTPTQQTVNRGGAWLQVGSFADSENAQVRREQMLQRQWPAEIVIAEVQGKRYHRVLVGPLAPSDVPNYLNVLKSMDINAREITR